jgi:hypothetical protein
VARNGHPREQISAGLRFEILRRCNFACYYCGVPAAMGVKVLHVDHVVPVALGGTNDPWNLVAACWDCNAGKASGVPTDDLVRRVRGDFCAYLESTGLEVISCRFCAMPVQVGPDEDLTDHCGLCDAIMFYGYDAGAGQARQWVAP